LWLTVPHSSGSSTKKKNPFRVNSAASNPHRGNAEGLSEGNMAQQSDIRISASVGRDGNNDRNDVLTVQKLINDHLPKALSPLEIDGECGTLTIEAIEDIQRQFLRMTRPDGRVDPDGETFRFLTGGSAPHPGSSGTLS
jgi:hypothetical protein